MKLTIRLFCLLLLISSSIPTIAQKPLLIHDLTNFTLDSLFVPAYDTTLLRDFTAHAIGNHNANVAVLESTPPVNNVFNGSQFTMKERAANQFSVTDFPLRAAVQVFRYDNDTLKNACSGTMISRRHVLTGAHCVSEVFTNLLLSDSFQVAPGFDQGTANFNFSWVDKVYFYRDWELNGEDFAVLELSDALGEVTGWAGIGFEEVDSLLAEGLYYKFPYPNQTILQIDPGTYNGDTLYAQYGKVDYFQENYVGINGGRAVPGESGSALLQVENNAVYRVMGTLTWSGNMQHNRLRNRTFHGVYEVIRDDLVGREEGVEDLVGLSVFPNPVAGVLTVELAGRQGLDWVEIYDGRGVRLLKERDTGRVAGGGGRVELDLAGWPAGVYFLRVGVGDMQMGRKVVVR